MLAESPNYARWQSAKEVLEFWKLFSRFCDTSKFSSETLLRMLSMAASKFRKGGKNDDAKELTEWALDLIFSDRNSPVDKMELFELVEKLKKEGCEEAVNVIAWKSFSIHMKA
ncbi:hypothetical protein OQA88_3059 [Cercophora sp. LCS_1]